MSQRNILILSITLLGLVLGFNNCSDVSFEPNASSKSGSGSSTGGPDDDLTGAPNDDATGQIPVSQAIANCAQAQADGVLLTLNKAVVFEDTKVESGRSQVCQFDMNGNSSMTEGKMQARYEQAVNLGLPANAVLCDLEMQTDVQSFKYDDVFLLTFNGFVLATNNKTALFDRVAPSFNASVSNNSVPIFKYDWMALRASDFENVADDYCMGIGQGLASCSWPISEVPGSINFSFHPELLIHLGLTLPSAQQHFGFAVSGDNDPNIDCYHERLEFDVQAKYYLK